MSDAVKTGIEVMAFLLPERALGQIVGALLVLSAIFVITGRLKLEWIGDGVRHIFRWLRCKIRDKHHWRPGSLGAVDLCSGNVHGTLVCSICGKSTVAIRSPHFYALLESDSQL